MYLARDAPPTPRASRSDWVALLDRTDGSLALVRRDDSRPWVTLSHKARPTPGRRYRTRRRKRASTWCEALLPQVRQDAALDHGVARLLGVEVGVVDPEVKTAAFAARRGAGDDDLGDGGDVAELEEIA